MRRLSSISLAIRAVLALVVLALAVVPAAANEQSLYVAHLPLVLNERPPLPPVIPESTNVLTGSTLEKLASVSEDGSTITFSQSTAELVQVQPGEVIVAGPSARAPHGFLRRVTAVETSGGQVTLRTEPATLEEAIEQGSIRLRRTFTPADVQQGAFQAQGVQLLGSEVSGQGTKFLIRLEDMVLYDRDGNQSTRDDQVRANGMLEFEPSISLDIDISLWKITYFNFVAEANEKAQVEITSGLEERATLWRMRIASYPLGAITVFVGPVPVVFTVEMPIYVTVEGKVHAGLVMGATQELSTAAGARWQDGRWEPVSRLTNRFSWNRPRLSAGGEVKAAVPVGLLLKLYGFAGPGADVRAFVKLDADFFRDPWWILYGGLEVPVAVEVSVLGKTLARWERIVIQFAVPLAQAESATPTPTSTPTVTRTITATATPTSTPPSGFSCDRVSEIPRGECQALVALYESTNGQSWTNKAGWLENNTPCSWYGVTCDAGHVVELSLWGNQLSGEIPPQIGNLTNLQVLDLRSNQLSGSIPPEIGNLTNLQRLDLGSNRLSGSIPSEIGNLRDLRVLDLWVNRLSGEIPPQIGNLTNLQKLGLSNNQLSGSIPPEVGNLTNLQLLYLGSNQLSGSIPPQIGNLTNLRELYLSYNQLSGSIPPEIGNLTNLQGLALGSNQLSGSIPPEIGNLTNLQGLNLGSNQLSGSIPPEIGNLANLVFLNLGSNQLSGSIPPEIGNLTSLMWLYLDSNQLSGPLPRSLMSLRLSIFWFNSTNLCEPGDAEFQAWLASIPDLKRTGVICP